MCSITGSSLNPSHLPGLERTSNPRTGQAVKTSVSSLAHPQHESPPPVPSSSESSSSAQPSWKGAWARRQEAKIARRRQELGLESDDDEQDDEQDDDERRRARTDGKIPIPPIPDLRYEQGILSSIKPFLHSRTSKKGKVVQEKETEKHELDIEAAQETVLASTQLTAEGGDNKGVTESDVLMGPMRVEWGNVSYVLFRDQVKCFPFLERLSVREVDVRG